MDTTSSTSAAHSDQRRQAPRQRCNAALKRLQAAGLLEIEYCGITVTNLEGLRRRVE